MRWQGRQAEIKKNVKRLEGDIKKLKEREKEGSMNLDLEMSKLGIHFD